MGSRSDLARLSDLKSWLGMSSADDDVLLERLITQTSRAILAYLNRPSILPEFYTESFDGENRASIFLRQWPVISVESCRIDGTSVPISVGDGTPAFGCVIDAAESSPPGRMQRLFLRGGIFAAGLQNVSISYYAGYQVTNEFGVVPSTVPFEFNVLAPYGDFASDVGVRDTSGVPFVKVASDPASGEYACVNGVYSFSSVDAGRSVHMTYGYVPADIVRSCIDWVADQYQYRTRIGQHTKSLGGEESVSFIVKDMPDLTRMTLQPYRRIVAP
jgi:hypothetical protein